MSLKIAPADYTDTLDVIWAHLQTLSNDRPRQFIGKLDRLIHEKYQVFSDLIAHVGESTFYSVVDRCCDITEAYPKTVTLFFAAGVNCSQNELFKNEAKVRVTMSLILEGKYDQASLLLKSIDYSTLSEVSKKDYRRSVLMLVGQLSKKEQ